ncbi:MAG: hypothetical protein AAF236_15460 [Verrucomicrobiota bacterium]
MRVRFIVFALLALIVFLIGEWAQRPGQPGVFSGLDEDWLDFCIGNSGGRFNAPAVTLVRITDEFEPLTIGDEDVVPSGGQQLSRLDYATILGFVGKLNPKSVAFAPTPIFDEARALNQTDIFPLRDAAMKLPRLTVAAAVAAEAEGAAPANSVAFSKVSHSGDPSSLIEFSKTTRSPDRQLLANGDPAFTEVESATNLLSDGEVRVPLVARSGDEVCASLPLLAAAKHLGISPDQISVELASEKPFIRLGPADDEASIEIPIAADGTFRLPPHSGLHRVVTSPRITADGGEAKDAAENPLKRHHFSSVTATQLAYTGRADDEVVQRILAQEGLRGRFDSIAENIVLIGYDRVTDRRIPTARGQMLSAASVIARTIATIQSERFISTWSLVGRIIGAVVILAISVLLLRFRRVKLLIGTLVAALIFFTGVVVLFNVTLSWTSPFVHFTLFLLMAAIGLLIPLRKKIEPAPQESETAPAE